MYLKSTVYIYTEGESGLETTDLEKALYCVQWECHPNVVI